MNRVDILLVFLVAWLAAFAQTQFPVFRALVGVPPAIMPAVVAHAALSHGLGVTVALSVLAGLAVDALSASRIGASVGPMFLLGFLLHLRRHLILRDQRYAQAWIGFGAGVGVHLLVLLVLHSGSREPVAGWGAVSDLLLLGLLNAVACPALFLLHDTLGRAFNYRTEARTPFRQDRETKRGRHDTFR